MSDIKLCRDCRHYFPSEAESGVCHLSPKPLDYVHGRPTGFYKAQIERDDNNGCGPSGKNWEPK